MQPNFTYNPELSLKPIVLDSDNERQTIDEIAFYGLVNSIQRKGLITPIGVEPFKRKYKVIYGNRRVLACKKAGLKTIKAKIYRGLSEEQRFEMQVTENATKVKIPSDETAENLWGYYKYLLSEKAGLEIDKLDQFRHYWNLPKEARQTYSLTDLARRTGFSDWAIRMAFRYVHLNERIKDMVKDGKLSYSFAQEVARIEDRNEQLIYLARVLSSQKKDDGIKNRDTLSTAVTVYLEEKSSKSFKLELTNGNKKNPHKDLEDKLTKSTKFLGNLAVLINLKPDLKKASTAYRDEQGTIENFFSESKEGIEELRKKLETIPTYKGVVETLERKRKSLFNYNFTPGKGTKDILEEAEYRIVPTALVKPNLTQPRKTFDKKKLQNLADTISNIGLLSPPLVREVEGEYHLVVGHRRTAASKLAGLRELEVLVCNITDEEAREIQYEEDIYEKVILSERAKKLHQLYLIKKKKDENLTLRRFAKEYSSLGATSIIHALMFASLPKEVKLMHQRGLLHYSTAVAIADELKPEEMQDWAIESSLLNYKARELRRKIYESKHQLSLFAEDKDEGRGRFIASQVKKSIGLLPEITKVLGKVGRRTLEKIVLFQRSYESINV